MEHRQASQTISMDKHAESDHLAGPVGDGWSVCDCIRLLRGREALEKLLWCSRPGGVGTSAVNLKGTHSVICGEIKRPPHVCGCDWHIVHAHDQ